jgi:hypothetical protein
MRYEDLTVAIEVMERVKTVGDVPSEWQKIASEYGAYTANGITSQCIVFPNHSFVLKWEHWAILRNEAPSHSLGPIPTVAPEDAEYFPITLVDGPFVIQERVDMYVHRVHKMTEDEKFAYELAIARIGIKYNIGDLHCHNIGLRLSDNHPVIFDVGLNVLAQINLKRYLARSGVITDTDIHALIANTHMWSSDEMVKKIIEILRPEIPALIA